ncbi:MAG: class I SAM-dependent methyltransferase, partial [Candidatus Methylomirabilaceae bacterium]
SERVILDVGCGSGRLAFALANEAGRIIGIDRAPDVIDRARGRGAALGLSHVTFRCLDAETIDYRDLAPIDLVVANLCMSDEILRRSAAALSPGCHTVFAAFHRDQWKESSRVSRYAYAERQLERALAEAGFEPVYLGVEQEVLLLAAPADGLAYLEASGLAARWKSDGRWEGFLVYLQDAGRQLTTKARVIVKARRR